MRTGVKVYDAMTRSPVTVGPGTSIKDCAKIMAKNKVGSLIIKENGNLLGIIKERDIVRSIVLENKKPAKELVKDYMIKNVVTISPEEDIYDALIVMRDEDVRMLPVLSGKRLVGLLTAKDILKIQPSLFDLLAERIILKEEASKPIFSSRDGYGA